MFWNKAHYSKELLQNLQQFHRFRTVQNYGKGIIDMLKPDFVFWNSPKLNKVWRENRLFYRVKEDLQGINIVF